MRIALSMGHYISRGRGGLRYDPGAVNGDVTEESIVGQVANFLMKDEFLLRDYDLVPIPRTHIVDRVKIVNVFHEIKPFDLAVEIHMNSFSNSSVSGTEVLYYHSDIKSQRYAKIMSASISKRIGSRNRGAKPRVNLAFLRGAPCPAIMTESEFISNPQVLQRLKRGDFVRDIFRGHAEGFREIQRLK